MIDWKDEDLIELSLRPEVWDSFLREKISAGHMDRREEKQLRQYVEEKRYVPVARAVLAGEELPAPYRKVINKLNGKKRVVYIYPADVNTYLKLIGWLLHRYDDMFPVSLYSFRQNRSAKDAVRRLGDDRRLRYMYSYKTDVHDYFNSVPVDSVLIVLEEVLKDQKPLFALIKRLLENPCVRVKEGVAKEYAKGIMAGTPLSPFLANLYLMDMDRCMEKKYIYLRYSDDIIVFGKTHGECEEAGERIHAFLTQKGLSVNPAKDEWRTPEEGWSYLGVTGCAGVTDISRITMEKLKGKMRRKARALLRWREKKGVPPEGAVKAYIRHFNRKLYENPVHNELTWCRYYLPLITTDRSLKELDHYMVSCIRFLMRGRHDKAAYRLRYETIQSLGYRSLVHEYYKEKQEKQERQEEQEKQEKQEEQEKQAGAGAPQL